MSEASDAPHAHTPVDDATLGIRTVTLPELERLVALTARLRGPGGCPWDADQTHASLTRYLVEETYELVEAIETRDVDGMAEELGDVLYQVLLHSDLAAATPSEGFDLETVAARMTAKMVGRHPHVFGHAQAATADDVAASWDDFKRADKAHRTSVLDGIPRGMPALALADKVLGRAERAGVGGDADRGAGVAPGEAADASPVGRSAGADPSDEDELGALLLGVVARARRRGLDPERALRAAVRGLEDEVRDAEAHAR